MADLGDIRAGLVVALGQVDGLTVTAETPDAVNVPAAFLQPASPFVDYHQKMGRSLEAVWTLICTVLTGRVNERAGQRLLDTYVSPGSPLVAALTTRQLDGVPSCQYVTVLRGERYGVFRMGGIEYLGFQLILEVRA